MSVEPLSSLQHSKLTSAVHLRCTGKQPNTFMLVQEFETELKNATEEGKDAVKDEKEKLQR